MTTKPIRVGSSRAALAIALAAITASSPALAQEASAVTPAVEPTTDTAAASTQTASPPSPESNGAQVEEIVVTAQFREQNLQSTPIAITAISGAMLQSRSQTDVQQIANQAPNVTLRPGAANFGPSLVASIRGVGQTDFNPAVEPGVGLYVDDVYYATLTGSIFDLLDLDRVEVLRGPQGTLAGRNSIGGAIKLFSKRPTGAGTGFVAATYGSRNRIDLRAGADFNLAPDLDARIAGVSKSQRGYVKVFDFGCLNPPGSANNPAIGGVAPLNAAGNCVVGRQGEVDYQAVRGQLRYHPSEAVDINFIADYTHDEREPVGSVLTFANNAAAGGVRGGSPAVPYDQRFLCGRYCNFASFASPADPANGFPYSTTRDGVTRFDGYGFSLQGDFELSDTLQLTSITAYRRYTALFTNDDDLSPLPVTSSRSDLSFRFFSQELRLNGEIGDGFVDYTVGGFYNSQRSVYGTVQDLRWAGLQFASLGDRVPAHSKAVFAHATVHATDVLTLTGGIRYTDEDKTYNYSRRFPDGTPGQPLVGSLDGLSGKYQRKRVDYRANLQYQFADTVMGYAQFSTGFKGGGINPRPYFASQVQPFGPETIQAYELGLKTDLFDRRARINVSAFFNDYKDIQLTLLSCPQFNPPGLAGVPLPCALPANSGDAHVKGIEIETSLRPAAGLLIDGAVSYLDFDYRRIDPAASGPGGVLRSYVAPTTPKWKWSLGAQYAVDLAGSGTLTPRFDISYQSSNFSNAVNAPTNRVPAFTLANTRLTWQNGDKDLDISAEVTNVFDKYYYLNTFDLAASAGYASAIPGRPREWALTVTKRF